MMWSLGPGDEVDVIGPLGHGFERHRDRKVQVLLAGGMGAMGLFMLGEEIFREEFGYALVCRDGPVFDIQEVIMDKWENG
jgi:NAD(P)H-flavin reductase